MSISTRKDTVPATRSATPQNSSPQHSALSRLFPACVFLLALCALVAALYGNGYGSLPPVEQRYSKAKNELDNLRSGDARAAQRESWLRVADAFQQIYDLDPKWANRPAALFRKAESLHGLARRSGSQRDYQQAAATFEEFAMRHADSRLAGDALLNAAEITANMGDSAGALRLLTRLRTQYAHSGKLQQALELERKLKAQSAPRQTTQPKSVPRKKSGELTQIAWKTFNANHVQITVELDSGVNWQVRRVQAKNAAGPSSLLLELQGALPADQIRGGARITDSPLSAVRVDDSSGEKTRLFFDFAKIASYETRVEQSPFRIILDVLAQDSKSVQLPDSAPAKKQGKNAQTAQVLPVTAPRDLASQLALTVHTVFIDAGHGGKDPGTSHNGLVERELTLDVARRVGRLLQNQGLEVQYSREKDVYLALDERTRMANTAKADLFVSLHINASTDTQASGFETFYLDIASNADAARLATMENAGSDKKMGDLTAILADFMLSARTQESRQLAQTLQNAVLSRLGKQRYATKDGGVKAAPLHVLIGTGMPAVLVELGYCSNREEARRLASTAYRQSLAEGIAEGILAYRDKLLRKQTVDANTANRRS